MTAETELKAAFSEIGAQVKKKVEGKGGVTSIEKLTLADYNALKAAGTLVPGTVYITIG